MSDKFILGIAKWMIAVTYSMTGQTPKRCPVCFMNGRQDEEPVHS